MINSALKCFTIGHSNHVIDAFIKLLKLHNINLIIDVRSVPYSRFTPWFNRENIKVKLEGNNISYLYMGDSLGARYTDPELLFPDGKVDFKKIRERKEFKESISKAIERIRGGNIVSLMCSEKDPLMCHRFVLISYQLAKEGIIVEHILENGDTKLNGDLEKELLNKYEDKHGQIALFEGLDSEEKRVEEAYEKKNFEIGYTVSQS